MRHFRIFCIVLALVPLTSLADDVRLARGKQLVESGGCAACHSPPGGAPFSGHTLAGWTAYNLTSDPVAGIGDWTGEQITEYLRSGHVNGKAQAAGPMADIIVNITAKLSDADRDAMAAYLQTIPAANPLNETRSRSSWGQAAEDVDHIRGKRFNAGDLADGARLYLGNCATCHGARGEGAPGGFYPSLVNNSAVGAPGPENLVNVILHGVSRTLPGGQAYFMPGFAGSLSDAQVESLTNYVLRRFGQPGIVASLDHIKSSRQAQ